MLPGVFRLFLSMLVVLHHSFPLRLGAWAVGMFFVLSGFWISRMWRLKYSRARAPIRSFYISRWWRLMPVFLSVQLIAVGINLSGFRIGNPNAIESLGWWITQPLIACSTWYDRLLPPAWSLDVEMQFYLIVPILLGAFAFCGRTTLISALAVIFSWSMIRLIRGASFEESSLDLYLWIFLVGCLAEKYELCPSVRVQRICLSLLLVVLIAVFSSVTTRELIWRRGDGGGESRLSMSAHVGWFVITIFLGMPLALSTVYRSSGRWDRWFGDLSYPLYMFHWIPRDWYYWQVDWARPVIWNLELLAINLIISIAGAVVLLQLIDRPAQRWRENWNRRSIAPLNESAELGSFGKNSG